MNQRKFLSSNIQTKVSKKRKEMPVTDDEFCIHDGFVVEIVGQNVYKSLLKLKILKE